MRNAPKPPLIFSNTQYITQSHTHNRIHTFKSPHAVSWTFTWWSVAVIQKCFSSEILREQHSAPVSEALQILCPSCSTAWPFSIFTRVFVVIKRLLEARLISTVPVSALILSFAPEAAGNDKGTVSAAHVNEPKHSHQTEPLPPANTSSLF